MNRPFAFQAKKLDGDLRWQINLPEEDGSPARNDSNRFTLQVSSTPAHIPCLRPKLRAD